MPYEPVYDDEGFELDENGERVLPNEPQISHKTGKRKKANVRFLSDAKVNKICEKIIEGNFVNLPCMSTVDLRGVIATVAMDIGHGGDMLPHFFVCRRVLDPAHDLIGMLSDDGADPFPTSFAFDIEEIFTFQRQGVLQDTHPFFIGRRPLQLLLDLRPGHQIVALQLFQLEPAQTSSLAELDQLVIIGL